MVTFSFEYKLWFLLFLPRGELETTSLGGEGEYILFNAHYNELVAKVDYMSFVQVFNISMRCPSNLNTDTTCEFLQLGVPLITLSPLTSPL